MNTVDIKQVVNELSSILTITAPEGRERTAAYETKLREVFFAPIVSPLEKLKNMLGKDFENKIKIDKSKEISICDKTLHMRKEMTAILLDEQYKNKRDCIAKWIVEEWGGIRSGKKSDEADKNHTVNDKNNDSLFKCIDSADKTDEKFEAAKKSGADVMATFSFNRIPSWSKYLAFKRPTEYAIYDARIIYSLNWLLYRSDAKLYLPILSGQNAVLGLVDYQLFLFLGKNGTYSQCAKKLLSEDKEKRRDKQRKQKELTNDGSIANSYFSSELIKKRALFVKNNNAFLQYCGFLKKIAIELFPEDEQNRLAQTEMLLFAIADAEIAESVLNYISSLTSVETEVGEEVGC